MLKFNVLLEKIKACENGYIPENWQEKQNILLILEAYRFPIVYRKKPGANAKPLNRLNCVYPLNS